MLVMSCFLNLDADYTGVFTFEHSLHGAFMVYVFPLYRLYFNTEQTKDNK